MSDSFRLCLYTSFQLSDVQTMQGVWELLNDPLVSPQRFDAIEDAQMPFAATAYRSAAELYDNESSLFVQGKNDSFTAAFSRQNVWLSTWDFYIDIKAMKGKKREEWLQWFFRLCQDFPVFFGYGCSMEEHNAKHVVKKTVPGGGRVTRWVGVSMNEFMQHLPGLYWLNIFGPELVSHFGAEKLKSLTETTSVQIDSKQVAFYIDEPVVPSDMGERLKRERLLAESLGVQFFFDRDKEETHLQQVPALLATFNRLKNEKGN